MPPTSQSSTNDFDHLPVKSGGNEKDDNVDAISERDPFAVYLEDSELPQSLSTLRKWVTVIVVSAGALCVTCASSMAASTEDSISREFTVAKIVTILSISLFVIGLGIGPLIVGPLSEVYGRNIVYQVSYATFFAFTFPVAFAPNISVHLIFRFITGFCGSAFLSVAGGSVGDLFSDANVAGPMAVYTMSPFIGPVLGPLISGFINQNASWRWTYYVLLIWSFCELVALIVLVPETYLPLLLKMKSAKLRQSTGDSRYWVPLDHENKDLRKAIIISCCKPFQLVLFDRMALLLDLWTSLILGILYLAFQAFPIIFMTKHQFNMQETGLTFLGIGLGMVIGVSSQPLWNRAYKKRASSSGGKLPPEDLLLMGEVGAILIPLGLIWLAFTTYKGVPWIIPIIASIPFGTGTFFVFTSTFTYLVVAYRPIAASAMAANSALRSSFAAAFPLFAGAMYHRLGTVGATALLAGLTAIMAPLPFIFRRIGADLRRKSRFAAH
ncbi:major facilitator superfamily domain-containing protein [Crepidotus variabilis]|uniref:Major facilitator superfamily domain-containing protein n=1 Tax=Crepidotus variabilis TaxID=179855 RepID=A0A9P6ELJ0_9AGAR|nr:major facilitator superfamily domain-containing protein [Crepidotus variabilis]